MVSCEGPESLGNPIARIGRDSICIDERRRYSPAYMTNSRAGDGRLDGQANFRGRG
jgi:hypothetical protein